MTAKYKILLKGVIGGLIVFCILLLLCNMNLFVKTIFFDLENGEVKQEVYVFFFKIYESQDKTALTEILRECNMISETHNWMFAGSVKHNIYSKMYISGKGGRLLVECNEFCSMFNSGKKKNIDIKTKKIYIHKFKDLLSKKDFQNIPKFLTDFQDMENLDTAVSFKKARNGLTPPPYVNYNELQERAE